MLSSINHPKELWKEREYQKFDSGQLVTLWRCCWWPFVPFCFHWLRDVMQRGRWLIHRQPNGLPEACLSLQLCIDPLLTLPYLNAYFDVVEGGLTKVGGRIVSTEVYRIGIDTHVAVTNSLGGHVLHADYKFSLIRSQVSVRQCAHPKHTTLPTDDYATTVAQRK